MANDRVIGGGIFASSILGIIVYAVLLFYWEVIVLAITAFVAVALLLGILAWIGYTMATTPPPEPIADVQETKPNNGEESQQNESRAKQHPLN